MNKSFNIYLFLIITNVSVAIIACSAQDAQFSQFYSAQLYINPAFTGNTDQDRVITNYRKQWPGIPGAFVSYAASYDRNLGVKNSSVGIQVVRDKSGSGGLELTNIGALYSYVLQLSHKHYLRVGARVSNTWRSVDYSKVTFADQLIRGGGVPTTEEIFAQQSYLDITSGVVFHTDMYWIGVASYHLNRPNQSQFDGKSRLDVKTTAHGGIKIPIVINGIKKKVPSSINLAFNYKAQNKWDQLDIGTYFRRDPVVLGIWYRGLPLIKSYQPAYLNHDAIILLVGYHLTDYNLQLGYSYDMTISTIRSESGGAHELSLIYEYAAPTWKKNRNFIIPSSSF